MYVLALLRNDILIEMRWYTTLFRAISSGDKYVEEGEPGDHYQIRKPVPCSTEMNLIKVGPDK